MNKLLYVLSVSLTLAFEPICKKLHISTDIDQTKDDAMKAGVPAPVWGKTTTTPILVNSSILFDFLYITVESKQGLTQDMLKLEFDDHYFANSSIHLENHKANTYSLKIDYRCKQYGGALVDYELSVNIPDCGIGRLYWTKICGTPMVKRHGLTMDISFKKFNQTIVQDGALVNSSYFDKDTDNLAFIVPANVNYSLFYLYMDLPIGQTSDSKEESKQFFDAVDEERQEQSPASDEFQVLEAILKMIPEAKISSPYVDSDHTYIKPILNGELANGGIVTDQPQTLIVEYNCLSSGETTIELNIPLDYFQDITMVFVKQCEVPNTYSFSFINTLFYVVVIGVIIYLIYTIQLKKFNFTQIIQMLIPQTKNTYSKAREEDYESEFKIGRIDSSGGYGSI